MMMVTDMTARDRKIRKITPVLVTGTVERGRIEVAYITPRGQLVRERLFCSAWEDLTPMQSCIDTEAYLSAGHHIGIKVLGLTPESVAEPVRQAVLECLAGKNQKDDKH